MTEVLEDRLNIPVNNPFKIRVLLYARVSSPPQKKRLKENNLDEPSLGEQFEKMREAAKFRGWQVVKEIEEVNTGGVPVDKRPGGSIIYQMAEANEFDVLSVYDNDRIGRDEDAVVAKVFRADMRFLGKQIYSVYQPVEPKPPENYNPYDDDSSLWLEAVSDTASSVYIRQFRRKHQFGMRKRIEVKKLITGTPPTGYIAERIILPNGKAVLGERQVDPIYDPIVKRIFNEYEAGSSFLKIAGNLNKDGLRTPKGFMWTSTTIKGIVNNPVYYGAAVYYKDKSVGKPDPFKPRRRKRIHQSMDKWLIVEGGAHPALIQKAQWEKCQQIKNQKGSFGRTYGESTLLSGLTKCGFCGSSMHKNGGWQGGYFSCNRYWKTGKTECRPNSIKREFLERKVVDYISELASKPEIIKKLKLSQNRNLVSGLEKEKFAIQKQLDFQNIRLQKAREAYEAGIDNLNEWADIKLSINNQSELLKSKLVELSSSIKEIKRRKAVRKSLVSLLKNFGEKFYKRPLSIQKILVREIIDKIVVKDKKVKIIFKDSLFNSSDYERTMEIAASGGHNILLRGIPGAGKTMLARSFATILPKLTFEEAVEVTKIYSVLGNVKEGLVQKRTFRSPHHTASSVGIIGGGANPRPGEISQAHRGVLFLDEFPEFPRSVLEALRQPLEDGYVTVSRANNSVIFPAKFILIAASNPCPCGYFGDQVKRCICSANQVAKYQKRLSGPILDRLDIFVDVPAVKTKDLVNLPFGESSSVIRKRVQKARDRQQIRYKNKSIVSNSEMNSRVVKEICVLDEECQKLMSAAINRFQISARGYVRILKVARTIADLEGSEKIKSNHVAEAVQYRVINN